MELLALMGDLGRLLLPVASPFVVVARVNVEVDDDEDDEEDPVSDFFRDKSL